MTARAALALALLLAGCSATSTDSGLPEKSVSPVPTESPSSPLASPGDAPGTSATSQPEPLSWESLDAQGPAAREDHTWTVTGDGQSALLFGGRDGTAVFGDLWSYDFASDAWTEVSSGGGPGARFGHEAVWV